MAAGSTGVESGSLNTGSKGIAYRPAALKFQKKPPDDERQPLDKGADS
jgi:hypothetical protein